MKDSKLNVVVIQILDLVDKNNDVFRANFVINCEGWDASFGPSEGTSL